MKKHIYIHTSNLDCISDLNNDEKFEPVFQYPKFELEKCTPNEYERIKTKQNCYHVLLGKIPQNGCPWCGTKPKLMKLWEDLGFTSFCFECPFCLARGPVLNIKSIDTSDKKTMEYIEDVMKNKFTYTRPWDIDFVNPYENQE